MTDDWGKSEWIGFAGGISLAVVGYSIGTHIEPFHEVCSCSMKSGWGGGLAVIGFTIGLILFSIVARRATRKAGRGG
jgi:hypothetical protein